MSSNTSEIIVNVHALVESKKIHNLDKDVPGVYRIAITDCDVDIAGTALDVFHNSVAIKCLDDFSFKVIDDQGVEIKESEDYEAGSEADSGYVICKVKIHDQTKKQNMAMNSTVFEISYNNGSFSVIDGHLRLKAALSIGGSPICIDCNTGNRYRASQGVNGDIVLTACNTINIRRVRRVRSFRKSRFPKSRCNS